MAKGNKTGGRVKLYHDEFGKTCPKCVLYFDYSFFFKDRSRHDGLACYCKACAKNLIQTIHLKDPSKRREGLRCWRVKNKDFKNAMARKYAKLNRHKMAAKLRAYRAKKLSRTPVWLTKSDWIEINWAYRIAREMTEGTGIVHHVDHIIPLRGKNVSGLHVPHNLQVITAQDNFDKNNKKSAEGVYV